MKMPPPCLQYPPASAIISQKEVNDVNISFKDLFNLDKIHGKKLVLVLYYLGFAAIVVNMIVSFIYGIVLLFTPAQVWAGLGRVLFSMPLAVVYFVVLRVVCELISALFDMTGKGGDGFEM